MQSYFQKKNFKKKIFHKMSNEMHLTHIHALGDKKWTEKITNKWYTFYTFFIEADRKKSSLRKRN